MARQGASLPMLKAHIVKTVRELVQVQQQIDVTFKGDPCASLHLHDRLTCSLHACLTGLAVFLQPVLSYLMHVDEFRAHGSITYTGDGM